MAMNIVDVCNILVIHKMGWKAVLFLPIGRPSMRRDRSLMTPNIALKLSCQELLESISCHQMKNQEKSRCLHFSTNCSWVSVVGHFFSVGRVFSITGICKEKWYKIGIKLSQDCVKLASLSQTIR